MQHGKAMGKEVIPGYKFQKLLGKGSMGNVFKAEQISMERPVAIKILSSKLGSQKNYVDRFFTEAKSVAKLNHPNIISGIDVGEHENFYYFVMEYVEGTNLHKIINKREKLPFEQVLSITIQIAEALDHAQKNNIVHRDVKPDNIMLTPDGVAKLCDLGLAKEANLGVKGKNKKTVGTPHYISPEQAMGREDIDIRADIYSLGATVFHMLTGQPPFTEGSSLQLMRKHLNVDFPPLKEFRQDIPRRFVKIFNKMVAKDRDERHQSPQELIDDLENLQSAPKTLSARHSVASPGSRMLKQKETPWLKGVVAGLVGLLLVGLVMYMAQEPERKKDKANNSEKTEVAQNGSGWGTKNSGTEGKEEDEKKDSSKKEGKENGNNGNSSKTKAQLEAEKAKKAYSQLQGFLVRNMNDPHKCKKALEEYIHKYPHSRFARTAQNLLAQYKKKIEGKETPTKKDPQNTGGNKAEKALAQFENRWKKLTDQGKYAQAVQYLHNFIQINSNFPWVQDIRDKIKNYEEESLVGIDKAREKSLKESKNREKTLDQLEKSYEQWASLGSDFFKTEIRRRIQELHNKRALLLLSSRKETILNDLRGWNFAGAQKGISDLLKDSQFAAVRSEILDLQSLANEVKKGHEWLSGKLKQFSRQKMRIDPPGTKEFFRIQEWIPSSDKVKVKWYKKRKGTNKTIYLFDVLPLLRAWMMENTSYQDKISRWGLFLLFSGDIEGAEKIISSQNQRWLKEEKANLDQHRGGRLFVRARRYHKMKNYREATNLLEELYKNYKDSYVKSHWKIVKPFFDKAIKDFYEKLGVRALTEAEVEDVKKGLVKLTFDFSDNPNLMDEWKAVKHGKMSPKPKIQKVKGTMMVKGWARLPIVFNGDMQVDVVATTVSKIRGNAINLGVFLHERGGNNAARHFIGVYFRIPGLNRIRHFKYDKMGNRTRGLWWRFPSHLVSIFKPNGDRNAQKVYNIWHKPRAYPRRKYEASFLSVKKVMAAKLNGSRVIQGKMRKKRDKRGTISLFTGRASVLYHQVEVIGKVDQKWLAGRIQQVIKEKIKSIKKP